jgi:deoxyribodipyrimidine photo-lyase
MCIVPAVVAWLRDDLRLDDNPALAQACATGLPVAIVYIWSPAELRVEAPRGAARWWLYNALADLDAALRRRGGELLFYKGDAAGRCLRRAMDECGAKDVFWSRRYTPTASRIDAQIKRTLHVDGYAVHETKASLLREPQEVLHGGQPYKVFTAYHKAALALPMREPSGMAPEQLGEKPPRAHGVSLESLELLPMHSWTTELERVWVPTRAGLETLLQNLRRIVPGYDTERDIPCRDNTSRLSPYLRFGQVSPSQIMHLLRDIPDGLGRQCFEKELHWREFAHHLLHYFPDLPLEPLDTAFRNMPWRDDGAGLAAWQRGLTGFPIVDAGLRQLWRTGWMHNRVRMIVGSFLVKDLLLDWRRGAEWFMDTLVDADVANNTMGWQWVGGCGPDAAPYFRVFNPVIQSRRFDPDGFYIRRYVPELAYLPDRWIHCPWKAPAGVLDEAGVELGRDYPRPVVDHDRARLLALEAYGVARAASKHAGE